jgi:hypothetical protein
MTFTMTILAALLMGSPPGKCKFLDLIPLIVRAVERDARDPNAEGMPEAVTGPLILDVKSFSHVGWAHRDSTIDSAAIRRVLGRAFRNQTESEAIRSGPSELYPGATSASVVDRGVFIRLDSLTQNPIGPGLAAWVTSVVTQFDNVGSSVCTRQLVLLFSSTKGRWLLETIRPTLTC